MSLAASVLNAGLLICLGAVATLAGVLSALADRECPGLLTVAELVDRCFERDGDACALLDRTVPASCLMRRSEEAAEAKALLFGEPSEGIAL